MDEQHPDRMSLPRRRGPLSKLETTTPLPEAITEIVDLQQSKVTMVKGIAHPPCCGVGMHPRRTGESAGKIYATCGHCGRSLVMTPLGGDKVHVRVVR
jgi:hypothetical protein